MKGAIKIMSESVAFIFKTLIKVPIIIFASFFVMNMVAFMFIYFKMLGFSYVVMQEVVENNYIAGRQATQMQTYMTDLETEVPMVQYSTLIVGLDDSNNPVLWDKTNPSLAYFDGGHTCGNKTYGSTIKTGQSHAGYRCQYGATKTVGVHCEYEIVWPLSYQYTNGGNVNGYTGTVNGYTHVADGSTYSTANDPYALTTGNVGDVERVSENGGHALGVKIPIDIYYTVPGLKYYADL